MTISTNSLQTRHLQVNYINNPLAVEPDNILFSWQLYSNIKETYQTAYIIKIATSKDLLLKGEADVWNSGKVTSSNTTNIPLPNVLLKQKNRYWWSVTVSDNHQNESISEPAYFDTGILPEDWMAKWIWKPSETIKNDFMYTRKEFEINKEIKMAKIFISAHNHYKLYVNGIQTGGFVSPAPSEPTKSKFYIGLDITQSMKKGINSIAAVAHYLGGYGQNYVNGYPGFIAQIEILYSDNTASTICSDETWKCLCNTPYTNGLPYQQNRRITSIEEFNANLEHKGWTQPGFDQTGWVNAVLSEINTSGWILKPQNVLEGIEDAVITPILINDIDGVKVFDTGKIITGWLKINIKGSKNTAITMRYSENLDSFGRVGHNVCNEHSDNYYDRIILRGDENEEWQPDLSYKSFRYLEVEGFTGSINDLNLKVISARTGMDYSGYFTCSNPLLNSIYEACIQTQKNNTVGQLVDCPHREQAQYLADSDLHAETLIYNFDAHNIVKKVLSDFHDAQYPDGRFPFVFPCNHTHPDFSIKIPEYDLHFCTLLWKVIYYYNDIDLMVKFYPAAAKTVNYYMNCIDNKTGLIRKSTDWHISDWPYPDFDQSGDFLTAQNCLVYYCLTLLSEMASLQGITNDKDHYSQAAQSLKQSILTHLYNTDTKAFRDCSNSDHYSQGASVIGIQLGLIPKEDISDCVDYIVSLGHSCSTLLSVDLLRVLFENGKEQQAYNIINNTGDHSWGKMIEKGFKTMWEGFSDIESHSHAWNAYPSRIMAEYLTGIKADSIGFESISIKPFLAEGLYFAQSIVPSVKGNIHVKWERQNNGYTLYLQIPANTNACIYFPKLNLTNIIIKESGIQIPDENFEPGKSKNHATLQVGSGFYKFDVVEKI